jgi:hypothetical protein
MSFWKGKSYEDNYINIPKLTGYFHYFFRVYNKALPYLISHSCMMNFYHGSKLQMFIQIEKL